MLNRTRLLMRYLRRRWTFEAWLGLALGLLCNQPVSMYMVGCRRLIVLMHIEPTAHGPSNNVHESYSWRKIFK
ncbi:hypothetical protein PV325_012419 [Microctonus aethiopoides]|nr:hypothetical protein PV325_012419 [Microctonus aethiopoides]KAK0098836.1 hypothetical protein PV326_001999 [Microctonus aethiopoides]